MKKGMTALIALTLTLALISGACALRVELIKDVPGKGLAGQIIDVSEGYARDYLFPKNLAKAMSLPVAEEGTSRDEARNFHREQENLAHKNLAEKLDGRTVKIAARKDANNRLMKPVTPRDVAAAINSTYGLDIDKGRISLPEIKDPGSYGFTVRIGSGYTASMTVVVE